MNLSIAAKLGFPALALAAALVACPEPVVADTTAPTIASVTPTGITVAKTVGKISVTFNEEMDTSVAAGVIAFTAPATGAPAITAPVWSGDKKTLSVTIPALTASSAYKFNVSALAKDKAGNKFVPAAAGYSFTTAADTVTGGTVVNATAVSDGAIIKDIDGTPTATPAVPGPLYQFYPLLSDPATADSKISMRVGDVSDDAVGRGALRFNLPAGVTSAQVLKAELVLTQYKLEGTGAWARGLSAEGTDFGAGIADSNGSATSDAGVDYEAAVVGAASAAVTTDPTVGGKVTLDVTAYVKALAAGKAIDLRLKFGGERTAATGANSGVRFYSADATDATFRPVLKITK